MDDYADFVRFLENPLDELKKIFAFDESLMFNYPYNFKGVDFYPVPINQLLKFNSCVNILTIRQEYTRDKTLMKLPYLWFLFYACEHFQEYNNSEYILYIPKLYALLELVTGNKNISVKKEYKPDGKYSKCSLLINDIEFSSGEFMEIRKIIFKQNGVEHDDIFLHEDALAAIEEGKNYDLKASGYIPPTYDELINKFCVYMKKSKREILEDFTVRDINLFLTEMRVFEDWRVTKSGEMSGMVTFSKPIPHWLSGQKDYSVLDGQNVDYQNSNLYKL